MGLAASTPSVLKDCALSLPKIHKKDFNYIPILIIH